MISIALNMIVADGEADLMRRCLDSFSALQIFDEIVIVCTGADDAVLTAAKEYTDKVHYFQWKTERYPHGNFAGARNLALDNTTADYVMWLDADDVLLDECKEAFYKMKPTVCDMRNDAVDVYWMEYALVCDPNGTPTVSFWRDRIFKRTSAYRWRHPVHELLCENWVGVKTGKLRGCRVTHAPKKQAVDSSRRNAAILEHEYNTGHRDTHTMFFYARDILNTGAKEKGLQIFKEIINAQKDNGENLYSAAMELAYHYAYGGMVVRPTLDNLNTKNADQVLSYLNMALNFADTYAEPYVIMGDYFWRIFAMDKAEKMYLEALKRTLRTGMTQSVPFYEEVPAERLAELYMLQGKYEEALFYNRRALNHNEDDRYWKTREQIFESMCYVERFTPELQQMDIEKFMERAEPEILTGVIRG
jgi:glycosyltransferase involved in cell wall biosynthesis